MSSQPFEVDPYDIYSAGQVFAGGAQNLIDVVTSLQSALDTCVGMAGDDQTGSRFGARYNQVADGLVNLVAALDPSVSGMATGLVTTANNFILSDYHSTAGATGSAPVYSLPALTSSLILGAPPSAIGSGSGGLADILGRFWLNGHQDKLRAAASAYSNAATGLQNLGYDLQAAVTSITEANSAASITAMNEYFAKLWTSGAGSTAPLSAAHNACTQLATACERYAAAIDQDHSDVESALWEAGLAIGATEVIGWLGTLFTGGGSDALAAWASSTEGAAILGPVLAAAEAVVDELFDDSLSEAALAVIQDATAAVPINQPAAATLSSAQSSAVTTALDNAMTQAVKDEGQVAITGSADANTAAAALAQLPKGKSRGVKTVSSEAALDELFDKLSKGGTDVTPPDYNGTSVVLADGTRVGIRYSSSSGGPTMDIVLANGKNWKVHVSPWQPAQ
jgi:hypothetical protein